MDIPRALEEINPIWLSQALSEGGLKNARVAECQVKPFPEGFSNAGLLARVSVQYVGDQRGPATLIARMPASNQSQSAVTRGAHRREVRFYQHVGKDAGVRIPALFHGSAADGSDAAIMLLEDLAPIEPGDGVEGCSYGEAAAAMRELAHMHARWWGHPSVLNGEWLWSFSGSFPPETWAENVAGEVATPSRWLPGFAGRVRSRNRSDWKLDDRSSQGT